jgi:hypothetical protein
VPEPPLSDAELRMVRGMIDEYVQESAVHAWFRLRGRWIMAALALLSAAAVLIASVEEIVRSIVGG